MDNVTIYLIIGFIIIMNIVLVLLITKKQPKQIGQATHSASDYVEKPVSHHAKTEVLGQRKNSGRLTEPSSEKTEMLGSIQNFSTDQKDTIKKNVAPVAETVILGTDKVEAPVNHEVQAYGVLCYRENNQDIQLPLSAETTLIGRDPATCDVLLENDSHVGRNHALLYKKGDKIFLTDLDSRNGSYINGQKIKGQNEISLNTNFKLGNTEMVIRSLEG